MKRFLALVETDDDFGPTKEANVALTGIQLIPQIIADTFIHDWNEGVLAKKQWDQFCENLFQILTKSELIDETGLHVSEYTPGSICRFLLANKQIFPEDFRDSMLGLTVMQAVKTGAKTIKKGKDIVINWEDITAHAGPMTEAVLHQMLKTPERSAIMMPVIRQYFPVATESTASESSPTSTAQ
ncbi:hypothetical protein GO755_33570 [Spirosoma sp. HMF4905]|uniref:Uncharacterized protein n=1 Tax=Spirosoma arboris TaxID=2682092 RepID=A0A7K1SN26_9BACT|nr:hypothetical protein [Spirosoma arboris]MVM35006.1 hypothetical protein [Spirosoma arboris]